MLKFSRRRKLSRVEIVAITLIVLIFGTLAAFVATTDIVSASRLYDENHQRAKDAGIRFSTTSLLLASKSAVTENAYSKIKATLSAIHNDYLKLRNPKLTNEEFNTYWAKLEPAYQELKDLSKLPIVMPIIQDFKYTDFQGWTFAIIHRAKLAMQAHRDDEARDLFGTASRLAIIPTSQPSGIGILVRTMCGKLILLELGKVARDKGHDPAWNQAIRDICKTLSAPVDYHRFVQIQYISASRMVDEFPRHQTYYVSTKNAWDRWRSRAVTYIPWYKSAAQARLDGVLGAMAETTQQDPSSYESFRLAIDNATNEVLAGGESYMPLRGMVGSMKIYNLDPASPKEIKDILAVLDGAGQQK